MFRFSIFRFALILGFMLPSVALSESFRVQTVREGQGTGVASGSLVKVHYTGRLADSTIFDSSRERDPLEFTLGAGMVIKGWDQGLVGMKAGEVRSLVVPPDMGYGDRAVGPIPANSVLYFEVEMVSFEKGLAADSFPANLSSFPWKLIAPGVEAFDEKVGQGDGARPGSQLTLHYTGWLTGGSLFGSSKTNSKPKEFLLGANKMIRGWEIGLNGVAPGAVRWLRLQPTVGYGASALPRIPPNSTLLYRIEIQKVSNDEEAIAGVDFFPDVEKLSLQNGREGLQYAVVQEPTDVKGDPAVAGKKTRVHYTGWLLDGTLFDSSRERGTPFEFSLGSGRVIRGWDLGVEGMRPGEKRVLVVPPGLGYGSRGAGPIPGNSTLVFMVEYLGQE